MIRIYRYEIDNPSDKPHELCKQQRDATQMLIQRAAKELCGIDKAEIAHTEYGKPYFLDLPIKFSVSHSKSRVIVAVSDREIGADIQHISPRSTDVAKRYFTKEENEYVGGDIMRFYEIWTKKEAYAKWEGKGLAENFGKTVINLVFYTENDGQYALAVYEK